MKKDNLKDIYPLSPLQEGMLYHALFDQGQTAYVEQFSYTVEGDFKADLFLESWQELVDRHDILRTAFEYEKTQKPVQIVLKNVKAQGAFTDISDKKEKIQERLLADLRDDEKTRPFDAAAGQLARMQVVKTDENRFEIIRTHHHILLDGWSSGILLQELLDIYASKVSGKPHELKAPVSTAPYFKWIGAQDKQASCSFWKDYLKGAHATKIPFKPIENAEERYEIGEVSFELSVDETKALEEVASGNRVTLGIVCRAIWGFLLSRYTHKQDVLFGTIATVRPADIPNIADMVGLFINTLAVRVDLADVRTFAELCQRLQAEHLASTSHQYVHVNDVIEQHQKFDHLFGFENYQVNEGFQEKAEEGGYGVNFTPHERFEHTHYDLNVIVNPADKMGVTFSFNQNRYDQRQIEWIASHYRKMIELIIENDQLDLSEIDFLGDKEKTQLFYWGHGDAVERDPLDHVAKRFAQQVQESPEALCVCDGDIQLTYEQVDQRASVLAKKMSEDHEVQPQDHVSVYFTRSWELVVGFAACMKLNALYVPIDPMQPTERAEHILLDSEAKIVLGNSAVLSRLSCDIAQINLDDVDFSADVHFDKSDLYEGGQTAAYMTYTSGSTGKPKGVINDHGGLLNLVDWQFDYYGADTFKRGTLYVSSSFDASVWEIVPVLLSGGALFVVPDELRTDAERLIDFYAEKEITSTFLPPAICEEFAHHHNSRLDKSLTIIVGGDVLRSIGNGGLNIVNNYGPTECSMISTVMPLDETWVGKEPPIGKPFENIEAYILDEQLRLAPVGVKGELYIGGIGVADGYWKRDDLTQEKFISSPFDDDKKLYRTGDVVYWSPDGLIYFAGREDNQVQLHGYRVELGEIEKVLEKETSVTKAAVKAIEGPDGDLALVGYVVSDQSIDEAEVKQSISGFVPYYMVPNRLVQLDDLPYSDRGKIDYAALPAVDLYIRENLEKIPPSNENERQLLEIWQDVLGIDDICVTDNFFALGGHSLSATRVMSRIRSKMSNELSFDQLFKHSTIRELAQLIKESPEKIEKGPVIKRSSRRRA